MMRNPRVIWINSEDPPDAFPAIETAFESPDGLLAAGGDLSRARLLYAYQHGIFPWFDDGQPILWWSPDPRCVLLPGEFHVSRRLRRFIRTASLDVRFNVDFDQVIERCANVRVGQDGTWITAEMMAAYRGLHQDGWAHSIEVYVDDGLVGGLYGLAIDRCFFGESMFSTVSNASKAAMLALCHVLVKNDFALLDCQVESPHLRSLGARLMPRAKFAETLTKCCANATKFSDWPVNASKISTYLGESRPVSLQ